MENTISIHHILSGIKLSVLKFYEYLYEDIYLGIVSLGVLSSRKLKNILRN